MSPSFGQGGRSPRSGSLPSQVPGRGPVPKFQKIKSVQELQPRVHVQPAYRRANPEGGFISVSSRRSGLYTQRSDPDAPQPLHALTGHLPSTYRICNPNFNYESSRNPRRVLTKPSKGVKNDGYDNDDSDYILYVNDILGSEEAGHKYARPFHAWIPTPNVSLETDTSFSMCSVRVLSDKLSNVKI